MHEDTIYELRTWDYLNPDGTMELGMRITSIPNHTPITPEVTIGLPVVTDDLEALVATTDASESIPVLIKLRNFPDWDVPLVPSIDSVPIDTYLQAADEKASAEADRAALLDQMAAGASA